MHHLQQLYIALHVVRIEVTSLQTSILMMMMVVHDDTYNNIVNNSKSNNIVHIYLYLPHNVKPHLVLVIESCFALLDGRRKQGSKHYNNK